MGPYGSVGAHIKTGWSPMAQDHFKTPPDPPKGYKNKNDSKIIPEILCVYGRKAIESQEEEQEREEQESTKAGEPESTRAGEQHSPSAGEQKSTT